MEFGPDVATGKKRPAWLLDTDVIQFRCTTNNLWADCGEGYPADNSWAYDIIDLIRLPASHPYYTVQKYNAENGTDFTYWPGGESAPMDWDGGEVLLLDPIGTIPRIRSDKQWTTTPGIYRRVIGYRRKAEPVATITLPRITRAEAYEDGFDIVALERLGLLKEESLLERFEREQGWLSGDERDLIAKYQEWVAAL